MTVGDWMITIIILAIPIVNLIMYFLWAFVLDGNVNRKTFCRASIYLALIIFAFALFVGLIGGMASFSINP